MNDYEQTVENCTEAYNGVETAYNNAQDSDIETLLSEALDKIDEARNLATQRA